MNRRQRFTTAAALGLALAGMASTPTSGGASEPPSPKTAARGIDFRSCHWLTDRKILDQDLKEIASVSDLILDRGSGRIEYLVIRTGTVLGLGGKAVAIPYGAFQWGAGGEQFVLPTTTEQLKQFPEFSAEQWSAMMESRKDDTSALRLKMAADAASESDPYADGLNMAKSGRIEGEIREIQRVHKGKFGEHVLITVAAKDGAIRTIALGPSWFVNGGAVAPIRGDKVVIDTLVLPRDPDQLSVATQLRAGDRVLRLRDSGGSPVWALKTIEVGGYSYSTPYWRFLLLSSLRGMSVDCRGNSCGKVDDVILERTSGEIGFLSIDPNQNFLGIGDTKRLIPWSVAKVALDGTVRIDASKEMVLASPQTPSDLSVLCSGPVADSVYAAYQIAAPRFEPPKPAAVVAPITNDAWSTRGLIIASIDRDSAKTLTGALIDMTEVKFDDGIQPAQALKIKADAGDALILLGPAWYMNNQKLACEHGDLVKVDVYRTTINGKPYWIARSLETKGTRVVLLDGSTRPAWEKR